MKPLRLRLLPQTYAIHKFPSGNPLPEKILTCSFFSITRTDDELSLVCPQELYLSSQQVETDWRVIQVIGPLDFSLTGILARLSGALARSHISLFAISTYDTDYLLVKNDHITQARKALNTAGCHFVGPE